MKTLGLIGALLAFAATVGGAQTLDLKQYRMIDLTHPLNAKTLYWPTSPTAFKLDSLSYGLSTRRLVLHSSFAFSAPEHGGTHSSTRRSTSAKATRP